MKWVKVDTVGRSAHGSLYSYGHTSTLCGHFIHVIGGKFTYQNLSFGAYDSILNINTMIWQSAPTSHSTCFHTTCLVDDKLYRIGGEYKVLLDHIVWFWLGSCVGPVEAIQVIVLQNLHESGDSSFGAPLFIMYNFSVYSHAYMASSCPAATSFV